MNNTIEQVLGQVFNSKHLITKSLENETTNE